MYGSYQNLIATKIIWDYSVLSFVCLAAMSEVSESVNLLICFDIMLACSVVFVYSTQPHVACLSMC